MSITVPPPPAAPGKVLQLKLWQGIPPPQRSPQRTVKPKTCNVEPGWIVRPGGDFPPLQHLVLLTSWRQTLTFWLWGEIRQQYMRIRGVTAGRTYEEGVGGSVPCQQLRCFWVKSEPKSHGQHQQARKLRKDTLFSPYTGNINTLTHYRVCCVCRTARLQIEAKGSAKLANYFSCLLIDQCKTLLL